MDPALLMVVACVPCFFLLLAFPRRLRSRRVLRALNIYSLHLIDNEDISHLLAEWRVAYCIFAIHDACHFSRNTTAHKECVWVCVCAFAARVFLTGIGFKSITLQCVRRYVLKTVCGN